MSAELELVTLEAEERRLTVAEAIAAVIRDLPGIGKDETNDALGWKFRGIEQMTGALQPLLGKHGLVLIPRILSTEAVEVQVGMKVQFEWRILMVWNAIGPDGSSLEIGPTLGVARNPGDKGANAAMTAAYKYALLQTFCVGDRGDDGDRHIADEVDATPSSAQLAAARALEATNELTDVERGELRAWISVQKIDLKPKAWSQAQSEMILARVSEIINDREAEADTDDESVGDLLEVVE